MRLIYSIGVLLVLLCAGCAGTYRDKALDALGAPASAVLISKFGTVSDFILTDVDGRPPRFVKRFELLPGEHSVTVTLNPGFYRAYDMKVHFDAKAGESYELDANMHTKLLSGTWRTWITEVSTGKQFAGEIVKQ
jgi:hypothetical protein